MTGQLRMFPVLKLIAATTLFLPTAKAGCKYTNPMWISDDEALLTAPTIHLTFNGVNEEDQVWLNANWNLSFIEKYSQCIDTVQVSIKKIKDPKTKKALLCELKNPSIENCTGPLDRKEFCDETLDVWIRVTNQDYKDGSQPIGAPSMTRIENLPCGEPYPREALGTFMPSQSCESLQPSWRSGPIFSLIDGVRGKRFILMNLTNSQIENVLCVDEVEIKYWKDSDLAKSYHKENFEISNSAVEDHQYHVELEVTSCKSYSYTIKAIKTEPYFVATFDGRFSSKCDDSHIVSTTKASTTTSTTLATSPQTIEGGENETELETEEGENEKAEFENGENEQTEEDRQTEKEIEEGKQTDDKAEETHQTEEEMETETKEITEEAETGIEEKLEESKENDAKTEKEEEDTEQTEGETEAKDATQKAEQTDIEVEKSTTEETGSTEENSGETELGLNDDLQESVRSNVDVSAVSLSNDAELTSTASGGGESGTDVSTEGEIEAQMSTKEIDSKVDTTSAAEADKETTNPSNEGTEKSQFESMIKEVSHTIEIESDGKMKKTGRILMGSDQDEETRYGDHARALQFRPWNGSSTLKTNLLLFSFLSIFGLIRSLSTFQT